MAGPLLRYTLLQVPDVLVVGGILCALRAWWDLPDRVAWLLMAVWVAKDAAMYPFVRRSLADGGAHVGAAALIGALGVTEEVLDPRGWVRVRGELWQAEAAGAAPLPARARVRVCGIRGLTLRVEPADPLDSRNAAAGT